MNKYYRIFNWRDDGGGRWWPTCCCNWRARQVVGVFVGDVVERVLLLAEDVLGQRSLTFSHGR